MAGTDTGWPTDGRGSWGGWGGWQGQHAGWPTDYMGRLRGGGVRAWLILQLAPAPSLCLAPPPPLARAAARGPGSSWSLGWQPGPACRGATLPGQRTPACVEAAGGAGTARTGSGDSGCERGGGRDSRRERRGQHEVSLCAESPPRQLNVRPHEGGGMRDSGPDSDVPTWCRNSSCMAQPLPMAPDD